MQTTTVLVFLCLVAAAAAAQYEHYPQVDAYSIPDDAQTLTEAERSPRTKRGIILLKKKLLLGALGLKAAKVGALGVAGALAFKKAKSVHTVHQPAPVSVAYSHQSFHGYSR